MTTTSTTIQNFTKCAGHLEKFYDSLPTTSIKFIWKERNQNWVSTSACRFPITLPSKTEFYLRKGVDQSFCYIYKKSHITFLLKAYQRSNDPVLLYNVAIEHRHNPSVHDPIDKIVNHGEHLTFGLILLNSRNGTAQIKTDTHLTMYNHESLNPSIFHRDDARCNLTFDEGKNPALKRFAGFQKQPCFNAPLYSIGTTYNTDQQHVLHKLYKIALDALPSSLLTNQSNQTNRVQPGGKPFFQYKNIHYKSPEFTQFVSEQLLVYERQRTLEMIYDEDPSTIHIVCIIDHDHNADFRSLVYVEKKRIMKAVYAHTNQLKASETEKACLEKVRACFSKINEQIKMKTNK